MPRTEVYFLDAGMSVGKAVRVVKDLSHSRYPVVRGNADEVVGFVHVRDLYVGAATNPNGWVAVDPTGQTSVPCAWAAGNAANPRAQVITAAGEGSAAAIAINNDLVGEDPQSALDRCALVSSPL